MIKKLWQKETDAANNYSEMIEQFTAGDDKVFDLQLAEHDVLGSLAHAEMLNAVGLLSTEEWLLAEKELKNLLKTIREGAFKIETGVEDVHSQVELLLTERIGEAGKKIHTGRSRNDQVLLDLKLFLRSQLRDMTAFTQELFECLLGLSEQYKDQLLPGYTHLQLAMPSSFGLWFGAYAEALTDDMETVLAAYRVCNKNPLGSGAGYGSPFPVDRELTTRLLDFDTLNYNAVYAQMTRGKTEKIVASAMANLAATLSKLSYDLCLYMNQNFGFVSFPAELTTGSSIMPHKKNPDVFELIRARCNRIQALPNELTLLINNLPSGYHRDLQLSKEMLFPAIKTLKDCLRMMSFMLRHIQVKTDILSDEKYRFLFSVEAVNKDVLAGLPFREAYRKVAAEIESGNFDPERKINHTHVGSIGNLCNDKIAEQFTKLSQQILA